MSRTRTSDEPYKRGPCLYTVMKSSSYTWQSNKSTVERAVMAGPRKLYLYFFSMNKESEKRNLSLSLYSTLPKYLFRYWYIHLFGAQSLTNQKEESASLSRWVSSDSNNLFFIFAETRALALDNRALIGSNRWSLGFDFTSLMEN